MWPLNLAQHKQTLSHPHFSILLYFYAYTHIHSHTQMLSNADGDDVDDDGRTDENVHLIYC